MLMRRTMREDDGAEVVRMPRTGRYCAAGKQQAPRQCASSRVADSADSAHESLALEMAERFVCEMFGISSATAQVAEQ